MTVQVTITHKGESLDIEPFALCRPYDHTPGLKPYLRSDLTRWKLVYCDPQTQNLRYLNLEDVSMWVPLTYQGKKG